ncbi:enoyl-CoA hydratase-related protein [Rhodococcus sp. ACS1]|uniref:enoyl-CoA hydratase-related protein n=1 Tax=Rhodococcus sp. ACS1 TaxID=2028570 RepID=UPI00211C0291|nr:enoyl-CoA hydratase-related protein [Rhodococcus sp. ACS1]
MAGKSRARRVTTADSAPPLLIERRDDVLWLTFNRPDKHNAQNAAMLEVLRDVLRDAAQDRELRALVIRGAGRSFTAGHDLREMVVNEDYAAAIETAEGRRQWELRLFVEPVQLLQDLPVPTICQVQGNCLAAGLMFAAATDLVVAADDAIFGSPIISAMALNDAEVPHFAWRLGERRAKQALWLDERLTAEQAERIGFVNWVVPVDELDAKVQSVVDRLVTIPRETLELSKASFTFMEERRGRRDFAAYHFASHSFSHQTHVAREVAKSRVETVRSGASPVQGSQRGPGIT